MEDLFKNVKPNPKQVKGSRGCNIGYGCFYTRRKGFKVNKRKLNRWYRKYGFDITETWSLDYTIMAWLSDNVGGFFRECGDVDTWDDWDLDNNPRTEENVLSCVKASSKRRQIFEEKLREFIEDTENPQYSKFVEFVIPRLKQLRNDAFGYPCTLNNTEEWKNVISQMIQDFETKQSSTYFISYFFSLWS